jgi:GT2 family glycosyltransferase
MPLEKNAGFSYGNNAPIRAALGEARPPELILLLNPDTVIREEAVRELAAFMDRNPNVGIAGSRLEDPDGTPQISSFRFPSVASELDEGLRLGIVTRLIGNRRVAAPLSENEAVTGWVAGASMMVRRDVFEKIGLLDEGYFMYYEEVDFCLRALRAGWPCWYVPASRVVHLVGQSSGVTDPKQRGKRLPRYWFDSRRRFFRKHFPPLHARAADAARATGHLLNTARGLLQGRGSRDPERFLSDFVFHSLEPSTKEKQ